MKVWPRFAWLGKPQRCWPAFLACPGVSGGEVLHQKPWKWANQASPRVRASHHYLLQGKGCISSNIRGAGASTSSYCLRHHTPSGTWRINGTGHAKSSPWYELLTRQLKKGGGIEAYVGPFNPALRL